MNQKSERSKNSVRGVTKEFILGLVAIFVFGGHQIESLPNQKPKFNIDDNFARLMAEEDTDGDKKITIDDRGDKRFFLVGEDSSRYEVSGTYYLANLVQELKLLQENGEKTAYLETDEIFENPVHRISRLIREIYWDGLTRRIDEEGIRKIVADTKTTTEDGLNYIYVPHDDENALAYFTKVAKNNPNLKLKVERLPADITPAWVKNRQGYHGILTLALDKKNDGLTEGVPFVVPGGRFNEMYGWDSYFESLGLLIDGRVDLAKAMVDNFLYEIEYYGKILNANRSYYLTRSQPPFITSMALAVFEHLPRNRESRSWLRSVVQMAIKEYESVWTGKNRRTATGLSRYYGEGLGQPPEVEPGHFDYVYAQYAADYNMEPKRFKKLYTSGNLNVPELDLFFTHDRSMRESGHDKTYRWDDRAADFISVDLNCLLYKIEIDIAKILEREFGDSLNLDGTIQMSSKWYDLAGKRKKLMNKYMWDAKHGLFLDYDLKNEKRKLYLSAVAFYPLWAGLADDEQARSIVRNALPKLEQMGGIAGSTEESRGRLSKSRPPRQWDYPYGWAPHQIIAWYGLKKYGFDEITHRLIYKWLYTISRNAVDYNGTIPEKFDVVTRSHLVFAEYGNVGTEFSYITKEGFGWMNASYQIGLTLLPDSLRQELERLIPPEWLFQ